MWQTKQVLLQQLQLINQHPSNYLLNFQKILLILIVFKFWNFYDDVF